MEKPNQIKVGQIWKYKTLSKTTIWETLSVDLINSRCRIKLIRIDQGDSVAQSGYINEDYNLNHFRIPSWTYLGGGLDQTQQ
jgi:hypothetical protein